MRDDAKKFISIMGELSNALDKPSIVGILKTACEEFIEDESDQNFSKILHTMLLVALKIRKEDHPDEDPAEMAEDIADSIAAVRAFRDQLKNQ